MSITVPYIYPPDDTNCVCIFVRLCVPACLQITDSIVNIYSKVSSFAGASKGDSMEERKEEKNLQQTIKEGGTLNICEYIIDNLSVTADKSECPEPTLIKLLDCISLTASPRLLIEIFLLDAHLHIKNQWMSGAFHAKVITTFHRNPMDRTATLNIRCCRCILQGYRHSHLSISR